MRRLILASLGVAALALASASQAQDRGYGRHGYGGYGRETSSRVQLAIADRRLNEVYQRRIAEARRNDVNDRRFRGWYSQENALRDAERIWINFRDAECRFLTQQSVGTRAYGGVLTQCLLDRTQERTEALREAQFAQR
jgi:uncharacterized protein YecT (DUF1311 family)